MPARAPAATLRVTPAGRLVCDSADGAGDRITAAFARGAGAGLLRLGAAEVETRLAPEWAYFRDLGRAFVAAVCQLRMPDEAVRQDAVPVDEAALARAAETVPPLTGGEYLGLPALRGLWAEMAEALRAELAAGETVASFLERASPVWHLVGRVHFHLAENRRDPDRPFAFLATYTTGVMAGGKPQHALLGQARRELAGARNHQALLSLLAPVKRAAGALPWVKEMVDAGTIHGPVAFGPDEALRFLRDLEALEAAGLVVHVPDFWKGKRPPRAEVKVTVGGKEPAGLGSEAVLDFDVALALDGERLTPAEARQILAATSGLVLLRGRWVEVDRDRLRAALDEWQEVERTAAAGGLDFFAALRLVAGAAIDAQAPLAEAPPWSRVEPGPWLAEALRGLRSPEGLAEADPGPALQATLRPYQRTGVRWLWWLRRLGLGGCLADDMGLGKTVQVIALVLLGQRAGDGPSLLVVPASLIANWSAELARFAPGLRVLVAHGSAQPAETLPAVLAALDADVVLTSYGTVGRLEALRDRRWDLVVLDEAQAIKNAGTRQARACKALQSRVRLALTGTPVENRLGELWSLFDFCAPGLLGSAREFAAFVRRLEDRPHDAYGPLRALVRPYILRRLKSDRAVIADLPDKTEVKAFCALSRKQAALYGDAVADLADKLRRVEGVERRGLVLAALMRLKQICNHPSHWLGDGVFAVADSGKLQRLIELAEEIASRQERVLVFTQFQEMTEPLAAALAPVFGRPGLVLSGQTSVPRRQRLVDEFQGDDGPPFFVLSLRAGGTGLNLTAASHVIHFDRWWNPAVEDQATDRAFRIGQRRNVMVHKLVCRGTLEEKIDALIEAKRTLSREVIESGHEVPLTELGDEELLALVSLDLRTALAEVS
jgi:superfamily II DNA or RNA helicase